MTQALQDKRLGVDLGARSYNIVIGAALLGRAGEFVAPLLSRPRLVVVSDEIVAQHHLPAFERGIEGDGIEHENIVLPAGEASKSFETLERLLDDLLARKVERQDMIVALGGGVIGDLVGFAAAILRRGIDFIQIPTTLLAQVDSSVGGKTAINTRHGKNLVGAFHQPRLVLADIDTLATLPVREMRAGYAEVVKYGLLGDADFFAWLEANGEKLLAGDGEALSHAVAECCRAKAEIVAEDEREQGRRALLNLGHTFAHALEAEAGYGASLLHGEAVAIGMVQAFELSARLGLCPEEDVVRVRDHLGAVGLPRNPREAGIDHAERDALLGHIGQDKKVRHGQPAYVLVRGIGSAFVSRDVARGDVAAVLARELAL